MKDNCYIDGISTSKAFGVWITKGGYDDLLTFPEMKDPPKNDWPEEDGVEVDLENPLLSEKSISISFLASDPNKSAEDFIAFISTPGYHTLYIPILRREWKIRLNSQAQNTLYKGIAEFVLVFSEDMSQRRSGVLDPGISVLKSSYELDDISFDQYGIVVDRGKDNLLQLPTAKVNLSRNIQTVEGHIYDANHLVFNSKELHLKCRFKAASMNHFWQCYDAFFDALCKPGQRRLFVDYTGEEYPCYYKNTSGFGFVTLSGMVMVTFDLTLILTSFRINETDYILASEVGEWIVKEEDGETVIDMKNY